MTGEGEIHTSRQWSPKSNSAKLGRRAIARLREWGVPVGDGVRLARSVELLESVLRPGAEDGEQVLQPWPRIAEAACDALEFFVATHGATARPPAEVLERFAFAVCGADSPDEEVEHSERDAQFELFIWGQMNACGTSCRFEEPPDLMCTIGDERMGIAAKRLWSLAKARRRLGRAADQVEASSVPGFIAVNAQAYLGSSFALIDDLDDTRVAFVQAVQRLRGHLGYLGTKPHVLGIIISGTVCGLDRTDDGEPWLRTRNVLHVEPFGDEGVLPQVSAEFSGRQSAQFERWLQTSIAAGAG